MKRFAVFAVLFFAMAVTSRADNLVSVNFLPVSDGINGETVGVTLTWDTTTNALSDIKINANGPLGQFSTTPTSVIFGFGAGGGPAGLSVLQFGSAGGFLAVEDTGLNASRAIPPAPGTYVTGFQFECVSSNCGYDGAGSAIVSAESPVTTPEPGALALLGAGLLGLVLVKKL
jgi:PEP-CTERM motif